MVPSNVKQPMQVECLLLPPQQQQSGQRTERVKGECGAMGRECDMALLEGGGGGGGVCVARMNCCQASFRSKQWLLLTLHSVAFTLSLVPW